MILENIDWTRDHFFKRTTSLSDTMETLSTWFQKIKQKVMFIFKTFDRFIVNSVRTSSKGTEIDSIFWSFLGRLWARLGPDLVHFWWGSCLGPSRVYQGGSL